MMDNSQYFIWHEINNDLVEPFQRSDGLLEKCCLRIDPGSEEFSEAEFRTISRDMDWEKFAPQLDIQVDIDRIEKEVGLSPSECTLSVVIRDRDLMRFIHQGDYALTDENRDEISLLETFEELSRSCNFEISVYLRPKEDAERKEGD